MQHDTPHMIISPSLDSRQWAVKILRAAHRLLVEWDERTRAEDGPDNYDQLPSALRAVYRAWEDDLPNHYSLYDILIHQAVIQACNAVLDDDGSGLDWSIDYVTARHAEVVDRAVQILLSPAD